MHELGIVFEIVRQVEEVAKEQQLEEIEAIVLEVGELSGVVPKYLKECFPAATDGTFMENTRLDMEVVPANVRCKACHKIYHLPDHVESCPYCGELHKELLSGRDLSIKEIIAR